MSEKMLEVRELSKSFAGARVLNAVSFSLAKGQTLGLLGPNGAGKSTLVNLICGLLKPDHGQIYLEGIDLSQARSEPRMRIGLVPQDIALFDELSAEENLRMFGGLYGLSGERLRQRIQAVLQLVSLADRAKEKPVNFSGGMKRRLNIAAAMLHEPELLILDEPTVGVDPQSRNAIFDALEHLKANGLALIYTSHYMEEVERLADHLVIIDHGVVIANDAPSALYAKLPIQAALHVDLHVPLSPELMQGLSLLQGVMNIDSTAHGCSLTIQLSDQSLAFSCLSFLHQHGQQTLHFSTAKTKLEEVFLNLTGRRLRD
jgi:ABC-2 type transport system ATP-binding protein